MTFGIELSFIPKVGPMFTGSAGKRAANKISKQFNNRLRQLDLWYKRNDEIWLEPPFRLISKVDTFRCASIDKNWEYHIEVVNYKDNYIVPCCRPVEQLEYLTKVFNIGEEFGLVTKKKPNLNKKSNTLIYYPTGGFHIHLEMRLFLSGINFFSELDRFNKNIWTDYCNRPYIKWIFDEWFDHINSYIGVDYNYLKLVGTGDISDLDYHRLQTCTYAISPRFQYTGKPAMPTYEFRFFDSPENPVELLLNIKFLDKWVNYHQRLVEKNCVLPLTLTKEKLDGFTNVARTWREIEEFFCLIGLEIAPYKERFLCNYGNRVKYGLYTDKTKKECSIENLVK